MTRRALFVYVVHSRVRLARNASTRRAVSPGIPLAVQPDSAPNSFPTVHLPNISQRPVATPVQVPYVPDFWNSARTMPVAPSEPDLPKVHVVAGSATHYDGGPMYNLEKLQEDSTSPPIVQARDSPPSNDFGFWAEFWESLGFPRSFSVRRSLSGAGQASNDGPKLQSRSLTDDERKGLYILLGIVGASWLAGALVNRPTVVAEEHGIH